MYQIVDPKKNAEILRKSSQKMASLLADMALAAYQIKSERQYVSLGFTSIEGFIDSPELGPGLSYGAFYQYCSIGALMEHAKLEKSDVSSLGFGCALELSKLGKNSEDASIMADDIKRLIARKSAEKLTVAQFRDAVSRLIDGEPVDGEGDGAGEGEGEGEGENVEAELKRLRKIASTVKSVEEFARIVMGDKSLSPLFVKK